MLGNHPGIPFLAHELGVHLPVHLARIPVGQKLIDVADALARHDPLDGYAVPPRELNLQILEKLDLLVVRSLPPWWKLGVATLAWVAPVIARRVSSEKALTKASPSPNASYGRTSPWDCAVEWEQVVVCQCQGAVALRHEVVDDLDTRYLQARCQLAPVDHPVEVRVAALVVRHDASHCENRDDGPRCARRTMVLQEVLYDVPKRLEQDVGELVLAEQLSRRLLLLDDLCIGRYPVQAQSCRGAPTIS
mmetsp:Transcript_2317/g.6644  ORF Transcript_2317/g.6644 Transcript_2317/m.6644 type:complete len:248 (-) Transcript_2317:287-1030(-)